MAPSWGLARGWWCCCRKKTEEQEAGMGGWECVDEAHQGLEAAVCALQQSWGVWPPARPTSPGPTSKNKSRGWEALVGSAGACCLGNLFSEASLPPPRLGCPVWLLVPVPVPCTGPLHTSQQPSDLSSWGGLSRRGLAWPWREDLGELGRAQWPVCEAPAGAGCGTVGCVAMCVAAKQARSMPVT